MEIHVEDTLFSAHIHPYFLRLNFPLRVIEDDDSAAAYDPSSGTLSVRLTKETRGAHFPDLDLLAKLLAPRSAAALSEQGRAQKPLIEVLDNSSPDALAQQIDGLRLDREQTLFARGKDILFPKTKPEPSAKQPQRTIGKSNKRCLTTNRLACPPRLRLRMGSSTFTPGILPTSLIRRTK